MAYPLRCDDKTIEAIAGVVRIGLMPNDEPGHNSLEYLIDVIRQLRAKAEKLDEINDQARHG